MTYPPIPQRLTVKRFLERPKTLERVAVVPVFHRWIQEQATPELLIDVADYRHIANGPGVILVGYQADYGLEQTEGRPGLLYRRKRDFPPTLLESLQQAFRHLAQAEQRLSQDLDLVFRPQELELALVDRLRYPNTSAAADTVAPSVVQAAQAVFDAPAQVRRVDNDPREALAFHILFGGDVR